MKNYKNIILIVAFALLVAATSILLYSVTSKSSALPVGIQQQGSEDIIIRSNVDQLHTKMNKGFDAVKPGGGLDQLITSDQFEELSAASLKPIVVGEYGRPNPFEPIDYNPDDDEEAIQP